jgi:hypothetical protein
MFSEEDVRAVNARLDETLKSVNPEAVVDRHEFCPYHPAAQVEAYRRDSDLRKPAPGMIYSAAEALALDLSRSWVIGDAPRDVEAGHTAGCRTILFRDESLPVSPAAAEPLVVEPELTVATLREAMDYIASTPPAAAVALHPADAPRSGEEDEQAVEEEQDDAADFAPFDSDDDDDDDVAEDQGSDMRPYIGRANPEMRSVPVRLASAARAPATPSGAPRTSPPSTPRPVTDDHARAPIPTARLESFAEQILHELRRQTELGQTEFSVSKLLAGIVQVMSFAVMFLAYLNRNDAASFQPMLIFAVWLEVLTVALLIMGRQK